MNVKQAKRVAIKRHFQLRDVDERLSRKKNGAKRRIMRLTSGGL